MSKEARPAPPRFEAVQAGLDKAMSDSIEKMLSPDGHTIRLLANLSSHEKRALALMDDIKKDTNFTFLDNFITSLCVFSAAENGERAKQIVDIVRQPNIIAESSGFFGGLRDKIHLP